MLGCQVDTAGGGLDGGHTDTAGPGGSTTTGPSSTTTTMPMTTATGSVDSSGHGPKFDLGVADVPGNCDYVCGRGVEFSYIWIASPDQGNPNSTVAKINTQTLEIEARYYTRPDMLGNASRTSVNLSGRAVAVANRHGGITKIWARAKDPNNEVGAGLLDPATGTWDLLGASTFSSLGGLQEAPDGRLWIATYVGYPTAGATPIDTATLEIGEQIDLPIGLGDEIKGISIDGDGYLWAVGLYSAYKIDTSDNSVLGTIALPFSYTYSDMTGWGLSNGTCPPAG